MRKHVAVVVTAGLAASGAATSAHAQEIRIDEITYSGSGCPEGTADVDVDSPTSFSVILSELQVHAGPNELLTDATKHCSLRVRVSYSEGFTFSLDSFKWRGSALLDPVVEAWFRVRYSFAGGPAVTSQIRLGGSAMRFAGDFEVGSDFDDRVWAPCGETSATLLATGTALISNLADLTRSGLVTTEQADGTFRMIGEVTWRACE